MNVAKNLEANKRTVYEEEDDGFAFTRTRSKRAKAEPKPPPIPEEPASTRQPDPAPPKKAKKRTEEEQRAGPLEADTKKNIRRSARTSGDGQADADPPPLAIKKRRKGRDSDETKAAADGSQANGNSHYVSQRQDEDQDHTHPIEITFDSTKIALPFADTPIIRRNQEMRRGAANGSRRSSLGMRGRRASSLIDTGKSNGTFPNTSGVVCVKADQLKHYHTMKSKAQNSTST